MDRRYIDVPERRTEKRLYERLLAMDCVAYEWDLSVNAQYLPFSSMLYQRPELYFCVAGNKLRILGTNLELDVTHSWRKDTLERVQKQIGVAWTEQILKNVYYKLKRTEFSPYYIALQRLKWGYGLVSFPLLEQFDRVRQIDGILYGLFTYPPDRPEEYNGAVQAHWEILLEENVLREVQYLRGITKSELEAELKDKADGDDEVVEKNRAEEAENKTNGEKENEKENNNEERKAKEKEEREDLRAERGFVSKRTKTTLGEQLKLLHRNEVYIGELARDMYVIPYQEGYLEYIPTRQKAVWHNVQGLPERLHVSSGWRNGPVYPSENLKELLKTLTGEERDVLDLFAELFARVFSLSLPSKYLWYLDGPGRSSLLKWLLCVVQGRADYAVYIEDKTIRQERLVKDCSANLLLQYNKPPLARDELKAFCTRALDVLSGETDEWSDAFQPVIKLNYRPVVLFIEPRILKLGEDALKKIEGHVKRLNIANLIEYKKLSADDYRWLRTCFAAYGLQVIDEIAEKESLSFRDVLKQFVDEFVTTKTDQKTNAKYFYNQFLAYAKTLPVPMENPKQKDVKDLLRKDYHWDVSANRSDKNRQAYNGVCLNTDALRRAMEKNREELEQARAMKCSEDFDRRIDHITNLVTWPARD